VRETQLSWKGKNWNWKNLQKQELGNERIPFIRGEAAMHTAASLNEAVIEAGATPSVFTAHTFSTA
jgi:hypothetical protein